MYTARSLLFFIVFFHFVCATSAQSPILDWQKCFGGSARDKFNSIAVTLDGGYIATGETFSNNGDVSGNHGQSDIWVVKTNSSGIIQWQKCYGGSADDRGNSIQQTNDGGYIIAGSSSSADGDLAGNKGNTDGWVIKLDASGGIQWQKAFGGALNDGFTSVRQTTDGGFVVVGYTASSDGDISGSRGWQDGWIVKLTASGSVSWMKVLGGSKIEALHDVVQTKDGGFITAGFTASPDDGDVKGVHNPNGNVTDGWLIKLDNSGSIQWQRCFGGQSGDGLYTVKETSGGGYILGGFAASDDGDCVGNAATDGYPHGWMIKADNNGKIEWQKTMGGSEDNEVHTVDETPGGDFLFAGFSSAGGDFTGNKGILDAFVVRLNKTGSLSWQKSLGGSNLEFGKCVKLSLDGGCILAGWTASSDGDVAGNHGQEDCWMVKLKCEPVTPVISITASANTICPGTTISFSAKDSFGGLSPVYQWKKNGVKVGTNSPVYTDASLLDSDSIVCEFTSNHSCASAPTVTSNAVVMKVVQPGAGIPFLNIRGADTSICKGSIASFQAIALNAGNISHVIWQINGYQTGDSAMVFHTALLKDKDTVSAVLLVNNGCGFTTVESNKIKVAVDVTPTVHCMDDITITAGSSVNLSVTVFSNGNFNSKWSPANYLANSTILNAVATPPRTITYTLTASSPNGCVSKDDVTIFVVDKIVIPNIFSPNHDGINDSWIIKELAANPAFDLKLFDRYGKNILSWKNYAKPWDGTVNGAPAPAGTYYYTFALPGEKVITGSVTIIR